jgi:hypothetical protein
MDRHPGRNGGTAVAVRKSISRTHEDLPSLDSIEAIGICIPTARGEILLPAVYKCPSGTWIDPDIIQLLRLRNNSIFAGDFNAKIPFW